LKFQNVASSDILETSQAARRLPFIFSYPICHLKSFPHTN